MSKTVKLALYIIFSSVLVPAQATSQYFSILEKDTFYFFLSKDRLLELSSIGNGEFYFVDEIKGNFTATTVFAVNKHQLLLINNDTIYAYSRNESGELTELSSCEDIWDFKGADPWEYDFMARNSSCYKLLACNEDSIFIKDDSLAVSNGQAVSYPYFIHGRNIYKYLEGFGYYLVYYISSNTDPGYGSWLVHNETLFYRTWYQQFPNSPPSICDFRARKLVEPNFLYLFNHHYWGLDNYLNIIIFSSMVAISSRYVFLTHNGTLKIFNYIPELLLGSPGSFKYYPGDHYLFRYNTGVEFSQQSSGTLLFQPLEYHIVTGIDEPLRPTDFNLMQNYPNPFNPKTKINYQVSVYTLVTLFIYDVMGNEISRPVNEEKQPGIYSYEFDGSALSSGVYFYKLTAGGKTDIKKMLLMK